MLANGHGLKDVVLLLIDKTSEKIKRYYIMITR